MFYFHFIQVNVSGTQLVGPTLPSVAVSQGIQQRLVMPGKLLDYPIQFDLVLLIFAFCVISFFLSFLLSLFYSFFIRFLSFFLSLIFSSLSFLVLSFLFSSFSFFIIHLFFHSTISSIHFAFESFL